MRLSSGFLIGFAGGVVASRLFPPFLAMTKGAVQTYSGGDPIEPLIREHGEILSLLDQMEAAGPDETAKRARLFLVFKRTLAKHAMAEEDVVYPLLTGPGERDSAAKQLYEEHGEMKVALFLLEQASKGEGNWLEQVRALQSLIGPHAKQEEEKEFPLLRQRLPEAKRVAAGRDILREEALVL